MPTPLKINVNKRKPDRNRAAASITISWPLYDRLDALAVEHKASISAVISGLLDQHQNGKPTDNEAN